MGSEDAPTRSGREKDQGSAAAARRRHPVIGALAAEFSLLFIGLPALLALHHLPVPVIPVLLLVAYACERALLRDPGFDRKALWNAEGLRRGAGGVALLFLASVPLLVAGVLLLEPDRFLSLPRERPAIWVAVMLLYPLLSVYPQELIYRAFLFQRYRPLFRTEGAVVWASALAFGFVHIIYGSWVSLLLSTVGGWLFARTYRRSRSLLLVCFQHALYGCLIFTIGLGHHFYRGRSF